MVYDKWKIGRWSNPTTIKSHADENSAKEIHANSILQKEFGNWGVGIRSWVLTSSRHGSGTTYCSLAKVWKGHPFKKFAKSHLTKLFDWKILNSKQKLQAEAKAKALYLWPKPEFSFISFVFGQILCENAKIEVWNIISSSSRNSGIPSGSVAISQIALFHPFSFR